MEFNINCFNFFNFFNINWKWDFGWLIGSNFNIITQVTQLWVLTFTCTSLLQLFSVVVTDLITLETSCIYIVYTLENPLGFPDAWGRTINRTDGLSKLSQLPWQCCNIVWLPWKPNLVVLVTLRGCHGNLVWLLW